MYLLRKFCIIAVTTAIINQHTYEQSVNLPEKQRHLRSVTRSLSLATALSVMERDGGRGGRLQGLTSWVLSAAEEQGDWGGPGETASGQVCGHTVAGPASTPRGPSEGRVHARKSL